jgi:mono/diheme cytochrome c family protein
MASWMKQHAVARYSSIVLIVIATNAPARAQDAEQGRIEFLSKCAECHGADGKGAGPIAGRLKIRPADLTHLARKNSGVFSPDAIAETIDGRRAPRSHRSAAMPIWGCRQGPPPGSQRKSYQPRPIDALLDLPCDSEDVTRSRIRNIVEYLGRIQEK